VDDLGPPSSYLALKPGPPVYSSDGGEVGKVEHVLADAEDDIFDGIVLDTSVLPGGHRFVDAEQVEEIFENGVKLKIDRAAAEQLPEPEKHAAAMEVGPDEMAKGGESKLQRRLSRAWDLLSGKEYPPK
jgi:uncharacterized protein YrrD